MTPKEALDLLDLNVARLSGSREDHEKIRHAVAVLQEFISPPNADDLPAAE